MTDDNKARLLQAAAVLLSTTESIAGTGIFKTEQGFVTMAKKTVNLAQALEKAAKDTGWLN